jgi:hypothetical protein
MWRHVSFRYRLGTIQPMPRYELGGMVSASADWAKSRGKDRANSGDNGIKKKQMLY